MNDIPLLRLRISAQPLDDNWFLRGTGVVDGYWLHYIVLFWRNEDNLKKKHKSVVKIYNQQIQES